MERGGKERKKNGRGKSEGKGARGRGGEESWNRAADWLRPALRQGDWIVACPYKLALTTVAQIPLFGSIVH